MSNLIKLIKNIRPYRSIHYSGLVIGGSIIGYWLSREDGSFLSNYGLETLILVAGIIFAFQAACVLNDFFDINGDKITNKNRPLITNKIAPEIYRKWGLTCLFLSLIFGIIAGWVPFAMICLFQILYTVYSVPPFRLKKYFPLNIAIVSANGLIAMIAGFGIVAGRSIIYDFPIRLIIMVIVSLMTSINMIHLKDREGDIMDGIRTIPSMTTEKNAKITIAFLTIIAYISVPVILGMNILLYFSVIGAGIGSYLVLRKEWKEGPYFLTYFVYYAIMIYCIGVNLEIFTR
ncbi:MAG: UbiA family prenyltransferase [Elusimicrobiota bacterium]